MMWYSIVGEDAENRGQQRKAARPEHLQRLQSLLHEGRLLVAGPNPVTDSVDPGTAGFSGSVIIAEFASLADAEAWVREDPYNKQGVYRKVTVKPFLKALP